MVMKKFLLFLSLAISSLFPITKMQAQTETAPQRIMRYLTHLASDEMAGRFPGTRQDTLCARYIRDTLIAFGYQPLAHEGFQTFAAHQASTFNVVMSLFGSVDADHETVVLGAHYDHLGLGGTGSGSRKPNETAVHYGADDNASGVAGIMEIARRLALRKGELKRNVVVVAFGAEEKGILGSKEFVRNPVAGVGKPVLMFNLDMIGRMDSVRKLLVGGVGTFEGGESFIRALPNPHRFTLNLSKEGFGPSDHAAFYGANIPVLYFNTGVHTDYHTPADHIDKIEAERMAAICDYIYEAVYQMATADEAPLFQKAGPSEAPQRASFNVSFGIIPDFSSTDSTGLRADFITEGKPAEKAGMLPGDVIKFINNREVFNVYDYMERLQELKAGDLVVVQVRRKDEMITLHILL